MSIAIAFYIIGFIITYGHAYKQADTIFEGERVYLAVILSAFWPLYWSVEVWK